MPRALMCAPPSSPAVPTPPRVIDHSDEELIPRAPGHLPQRVVSCILQPHHAREINIIIFVTGACGHSAGRTARQEGFIIKGCVRQCRQALNLENAEHWMGLGREIPQNEALNLSLAVLIAGSRLYCVALQVRIVIRMWVLWAALHAKRDVLPLSSDLGKIMVMIIVSYFEGTAT